MSARRLLRVILSLVILGILWIRLAGEWQSRSKSWVGGALVLSVILLAVVIAEVAGVTRRKPRDDVPKKPLGLDP